MPSKQLLAILAIAFISGLWASRVQTASPTSVVYSPIVSYREWEFELRGGSQDWARASDGEQAAMLAFGYGLAPRWFTEFAAVVTRVPGRDARVEALEWENIIQLTERGSYWLDAGLFAGYEYNRLEGERELKIGPMLQKEVGRSVYNLNVTLSRDLSARTQGADARHTEVEYAAQWRWRSRNEHFNPGMQAFGSLGRADRPRSEGLRAGPALFGEAELGADRHLGYSAAVLAGLSADAPDLTVKFRLEYEL